MAAKLAAGRGNHLDHVQTALWNHLVRTATVERIAALPKSHRKVAAARLSRIKPT
jgi:hypothetical protein